MRFPLRGNCGQPSRFSGFCDTSERVHSSISDDSFLRDGDLLLAKIAADFAMGDSRRNDSKLMCSVARSYDAFGYYEAAFEETIIRFATIRQHFSPCPCRYSIPLRADCIDDADPSAGKLRPANSVIPYSAIRKYGSGVVFRTTACYKIAIFFL